MLSRFLLRGLLHFILNLTHVALFGTTIYIHIRISTGSYYVSLRVFNMRDNQRFEPTRMTFLRALPPFINVDHQRNTNIGELLQVKNIVEDIRDYSEN